MAGKGGARIGAGRKPISEELKSADLSREALINKFGSLKEALIAILEMNNPILTKFVLEHAMGKPTDNINLKGELNHTAQYDMSKLDTNTLKNLLNAATTDKSS